jgi:hypothetical protein
LKSSSAFILDFPPELLKNRSLRQQGAFGIQAAYLFFQPQKTFGIISATVIVTGKMSD